MHKRLINKQTAEEETLTSKHKTLKSGTFHPLLQI